MKPNRTSGNHFFVLKTVTSFCIIIGMQSCMFISHYSRIRVENDTVKSTKRIRKEIYYNKAQEKDTPFYYAKQTFLKEFHENRDISYTVFDVLVMSTRSYNLEDKVYLMINDEVFPITFDRMEAENSTLISEDKKSVMTADSTEVSVVTGYTQYSRKNFKIAYALNEQIIKKLLQADDVRFRYYSGPNMITTKMKQGDLRQLKKLIAVA